VVDDLTIAQTESGTALSMGGAASTIRDTTIETAGDHVHAPGCKGTDDYEMDDWSDGLTVTGPGHLITGNTVRDASDVGIVFFGGRDTVISGNTVQASRGRYGMFAGIAVHPWIFGDVSGGQVIDNQVENNGASDCGGIHAGINIGTHMWGGGCVESANSSTVGTPGCDPDPTPPAGTLCPEGELCQEWAHVAAGETFTLQGNRVTGAQVNYVLGGLDLVGTLVESDNVSIAPRDTDWENTNPCWMGGHSWGLLHYAACHPTLPGWTDKHIHCGH
jgi:parallel beta-helix repeat protein